MKVSASFLSSKNIVEDIKKLDKTSVDYIHLDIMDGIFVPNKTLPFSEMKNIYKYTNKRLDTHLMVEDVEKYIKDYATLNCEYITFHLETDQDIMKNIELIKKYSIKVGLSIKPDTKIKELVPYLPLIDMVLIMSVEPGRGGQSFIEETPLKIKELKELIKAYNFNIVINVDGGINNLTKTKCTDSDIVVAGSYIINSDDFEESINNLR